MRLERGAGVSGSRDPLWIAAPSSKITWPAFSCTGEYPARLKPAAKPHSLRPEQPWSRLFSSFEIPRGKNLIECHRFHKPGRPAAAIERFPTRNPRPDAESSLDGRVPIWPAPLPTSFIGCESDLKGLSSACSIFEPASYAFAGSFSTSGTQKRKLVPCPGTLHTSIDPPCAATMARVMARPMPVPLPMAAPFLPR